MFSRPLLQITRRPSGYGDEMSPPKWHGPSHEYWI